MSSYVPYLLRSIDTKLSDLTNFAGYFQRKKSVITLHCCAVFHRNFDLFVHTPLFIFSFSLNLYFFVLDNCIKTSILFQHAADCFLGILNYIFNINCISVVNNYAQKFSEVLLFLAKAEDTKTAVVSSEI